jgi:hypothetical protein
MNKKKIFFFFFSLFSATNLHQTSTNNDLNTQPIETFNLLDNLSVQVRSSPKSYNPFAYIEFEHDYAIMAKQPVPVAKRLTVDGLNNMGVQAPNMTPPKPKFPSREHDVEMRIMYELDHGVDEEDMNYLKKSFQKYILNNIYLILNFFLFFSP